MANPYLRQVGGALWNPAQQSGVDAAKFMAQPPAVPYAQAVGNYFNAPADAPADAQAQEFAKNFGTPAAEQITNAFQPPAPSPAPQAAPEQPPAGPPAPQGAPPPGGLPREFPLLRVGSGYATTPAREMDLRGPTLRNAQNVANATVGQAIENVGDRNAAAAAHEYGVYLEQERAAKLREDAMMRAQAEREEEMFQRQQDFDTSVKALSQASIDPDRFWASRSTGQKIAGMVGIALGGFLRGAKGGTNPALDMINTAIDRDIKAQEFAYMAQRDAVNAKQTAFSMAMQKFNSADAARALARAAALDSVQAQLGQVKALYAGTDSANRADMALAQLEQDKMNQIAQGIRFIPSQQVATAAWVDPRTGLRYSEAEAKAMSGKLDEREFKREEMGLETAGKVIVEGAKAQGDVAKAQKGEAEKVVPPVEVGGVKLPAYSALTVDEAKQDREARKAGADLVTMIDKALDARKQQGWLGRAGSKLTPVATKWENEIDSLGPQMGVKWSKTNKLGTFDAGVERLIQGIQGDLKAVGSAPEEKLTQLRSLIMQGLQTTKEAQTGDGRTPTTLKVYGGK